MSCPIHGDDCPGDDGGFFIDGNHPDDMFDIWDMRDKVLEREEKMKEEKMKKEKDDNAKHG